MKQQVNTRRACTSFESEFHKKYALVGRTGSRQSFHTSWIKDDWKTCTVRRREALERTFITVEYELNRMSWKRREAPESNLFNFEWESTNTKLFTLRDSADPRCERDSKYWNISCSAEKVPIVFNFDKKGVSIIQNRTSCRPKATKANQKHALGGTLTPLQHKKHKRG